MYQSLHNVSLGNVILSIAGLIPGYWASFFLIDTWGRKPIQLMGFTILTALFIIMGEHQFSSFGSLSNRLDCYRLRFRQANFNSHQLQVVHIPLLSIQFLPELRPQHHHLRHSWRGLPHPLSVYCTRHFCSKWQVRCCHRPGWIPTPEEHRWYKQVHRTHVHFMPFPLP